MTADSLLLRCRSCGTLNRIRRDRLSDHPLCGKCRTALEFPTSPVNGTASSYDRVVNDWPMVLLVEFYTKWCGHCRAIEPAVQDIAANYAGSVNVLRIDVDNEPALSARFNVKGTPTFLLYRKGQLLGRLDGAPGSHRELREWVLRALNV